MKINFDRQQLLDVLDSVSTKTMTMDPVSYTHLLAVPVSLPGKS